MGKKRIEMIGKTFSRLTVISRGPNTKQCQAQWICKCECGVATKPIPGADLRGGHTRSCGCLRDEKIARVRRTHGHSAGRKKTPEFYAYHNIKKRCSSRSPRDRSSYFERGIRMCDRWLRGDGDRTGFECFIEDMGPRPNSKASIDRIDNDMGYSPENCRWATHIEQANNKRTNLLVPWRGQKLSLADAWRSSGKLVPVRSVHSRIRRGWPPEKALTVPRYGRLSRSP